MINEHLTNPTPRKPYEVFGLTEQEVLYWRLNHERFEETLTDNQTSIHIIKASSKNCGEFLFVPATRSEDQGRICMTYYGLGYNE